jgi:putative CGCGG family rSAM target protein
MFADKRSRVGFRRMYTSVSHDDVEPVTDRVHDNSRAANLEKPHHGEGRDLVVSHALGAAEHTAPGNHVNLLTRGDHGHPETHRYDALEDAVTDEYVEQCWCGGHVTRAHVEAQV